ncbi:MAG: hypothetical protein GY915_05375 [bacterium]|nr:hypothetical protein [bacterium]
MEFARHLLAINFLLIFCNAYASISEEHIPETTIFFQKQVEDDLFFCLKKLQTPRQLAPWKIFSNQSLRHYQGVLDTGLPSIKNYHAADGAMHFKEALESSDQDIIVISH